MKPFWKSKTIWIAIIQAIIGITIAVGTVYPEFQTVGAYLIVKSALEISLRYLTVQPIK